MNPPESAILIRCASVADRAGILALQERSLRGLAKGHMTPGAVDAFLASVGTLDDHLLSEGTYWVATLGARNVACGGWSLREPSYARAIGGIAIHGDPLPTVRAMYVDPLCAGRGLGRRMLDHVEAGIAAAGWRRAVLMASPMGVGFYARCGWRPLGAVSLTLPGGHAVASFEMDKLLPVRAETPRHPATRAA